MSLVIVLALSATSATLAGRAPDVQYDLQATISNGDLVLQHRFANKSSTALCLYPSSISVAWARLFDKSGDKIENVATVGFLTSEQTIYIVRPDGMAHTFDTVEPLSSVLPASAPVLSRVDYEVFVWDCADLVRQKENDDKPVWHGSSSASVLIEK